MALEIKALEENLQSEVRELNQIVAEAGDNWNDELTARFDAKQNNIDGLKNQIEGLKRAEVAKTYTAATKPVEFSAASYKAQAANDNDRKLAFHAWTLSKTGQGNYITPKMRDAVARSGFDLSAPGCVSFDQTAGTAGEGGNLLSGSIFQSVVEVLKQYTSVLPYAYVLNTPDSNKIHWPILDDTGNTADQIDSDDPSDETDNTSLDFSNTLELEGYDCSSGVYPITRTLLRNVTIDLESLVARQIGIRIARKMNNWFTVGTGSGEPEGIATGSNVGVYSGSATDFTWNDIVDLEMSVDPAYAGNARYMMHPTTYGYLKANLVDQNGRPLFLTADNFGAGGQKTLNGYPVVLNSQMPTIGSGNKVMLFGDFNQAFLIRMVGGVNIVTSRELYFKGQHLALLGIGACDSGVADKAAVSALVTDTPPGP